MKSNFPVKKLTFLAVAVALAMILSFIESQIPPLVAIPGMKIGLSNMVTVFLLYTLGAKPALSVSIIRVLLSALIFGSFVSMLYSLSGALLSFLIMIAFKKINLFSQIGVSALGGVFHNIGQVICASFVMGTSTIFVYLPALLVVGVVSGALIGILSGILSVRLKDKI